MDEHDVVIVGGGICGLATAVALHKNGIKSLILERAESSWSLGGAIEVYANGWRALDALGIGNKLRSKSMAIHTIREVFLDDKIEKEIPLGDVEFRPVKRNDLIHALADELPTGIIRYGCWVASIESDPDTFSTVNLEDGSVIKAKLVIGCDGLNSVVSKSMGNTGPPKSSCWSVGGFTNYPDGHCFAQCFTRTFKKGMIVGRYPINPNLVFWFMGRDTKDDDYEIMKDRAAIKASTIESVKVFPQEIASMVANCEVDFLFSTPTRFYSPWGLMKMRYTSGAIVLAGDSMHGFGPFIGQGGSCAMEDAVVLGRCLGRHLPRSGQNVAEVRPKMVQALEEYVKERRLRVLRLTSQSYLVGLLRVVTWLPLKLTMVLTLRLVFGPPLSHTRYDCGKVAPSA